MEIYSKDGRDFRKSDLGDYLILNSDEAIIKMKELQIENVEINDSLGFRKSNLTFFSGCEFIKRLSIICIKNFDIGGVHLLPNLRALNITRDFDQRVDFKTFPSLTECQIFWNTKIENIGEAVSLEQLTLHNYPKSDLKELSNLKNLKKLSIINSRAGALTGIENFRSLEFLDLISLKKLVSLEPIADLTLLKKLDIEQCTGIEDITPVQKLVNLESLGIHDCKSINSIKPLKDLKNLNMVYLSGNTNIVDGDLSPLIGRKDASFGPRKHYSHHPDQIDKLNGTVRPKQTWDW